MRIALTILIGIHGIIHLFGFLKAYNIAEFNAITQPIPKTFGIIWLLGFALFAISAVLLIVKSNYWWIFGFIGVIVSQFLIINYWGDAKYGTIVNIIILLSIIIAYSDFSFKNKVEAERKAQLENSHLTNKEIVEKSALYDLPPIVQKWLINSGVVGKPFTSNVHLVQELQLKMKPEQSEWYNAKAEQYFTVQPPAFNWSLTTRMNSVLKVVGRDKFQNGKGEMTIKIFSLIPVVQAENDRKVDKATLQRYLAEIVWFPSGSLSSYIKWESLNDYSAKATMEFKGTKGSGVFHFDADGRFQKFVAMRYKETNDTEPSEWTVIATKTEKRNGIKIPVECEASWKQNSEKWTWLKLNIKEIDYNLEK